MAGGHIISSQLPADAQSYAGHTTWYVIFVCIIAASGGLIFGYDIGVSGGVTSMDDFLEPFFPGVYRKKAINNNKSDGNAYCKFDSQLLTAFTSSLYLAGLLASFAAAHYTKSKGRIVSIRIGGLSFLAGSILNAAATNIAMLILGRVLLGVGVGFGNQAVPMYLSEMAPAHLRGGLNIMFQMAVTVGILLANLINYVTQNLIPWGWRLSLGLAGAPAVIMFVGAFLLPETPNSLVERGHYDRALANLKKIRGSTDVNKEFSDLVAASERAKSLDRHPFRNILQKRYRPQLLMALLIPSFQQMTGINVIMFYAPVLFQTIGFGAGASLYSAVITGAVNVLATLVAVMLVDKVGRRALFLEAGIQMIVTQTIIGVVLAVKFGGPQQQLSSGLAGFVVVLICAYVSSFAWSWGPLGWLVPSEIFPLEIRSAGQSLTVAVNLAVTFAIAQGFLAMLCAMRFATFFFFAAWVVVMTAFVFFLLPETKGVPIEGVPALFQEHWFWGRILQPKGGHPPTTTTDNSTYGHVEMAWPTGCDLGPKNKNTV